jgi:rhamnulokinase
MPGKIAAFCRETAQPVPANAGAFTRTILESLALTYAQTLLELESVIGRKIERLHIVGGGSRSELLNQLTADATGLTVVAGPVEATAIGNILIQMLALGQLKSAAELRGIVEKSFPTQTFKPGAKLFGDDTRARFQQLQAKKS